MAYDWTMDRSLKSKVEQIRKLANEILIECWDEHSGLKTTIEILKLSNRALSRLVRRDIVYLEQLVKMSREEVMCIRGLGEKTFSEIAEKVREQGFNVWA